MNKHTTITFNAVLESFKALGLDIYYRRKELMQKEDLTFHDILLYHIMSGELLTYRRIGKILGITELSNLEVENIDDIEYLYSRIKKEGVSLKWK